VGVVGGGQARADIQELPDPFLAGQVLHGADEKSPVSTRGTDQFGDEGKDLLADLAVDLVVVFTAEPVVPDPRRMRDRDINGRQLRP
jgi:hypothetical protein